MCTIDTIWAATFGTAIGTCKSQSEYLSTLGAVEFPTSLDTVAQIPIMALPEAYNALVAIARSSEIPMNSPFGRAHHCSYKLNGRSN